MSPYSLTDWKDGVVPPKGWDAADAVADGWTRDDVMSLLLPGEATPVQTQPAEQPREATRFDPEEQWDIGLQWVYNSKGDRDRKSAHNCFATIKSHRLLAKRIAYDTFTQMPVARQAMPWDGPGLSYPRKWEDADNAHLLNFIELHGDLAPTAQTVRAQMLAVAHQNSFDSLKDMVEALPAWDGTPRIDTWLQAYMAVPDTPYARAVGRRFLVSAIARAVTIDREGVKVDTMLVLEGEQGLSKSEAVNALFGGAQFVRSHGSDFASKDAMIQLQGAWAVEVAELSSLSRSDVNATKKFLSDRTDTYRPPYATSTITVARRSVMVGTFNPEGSGTWQGDTTGGRRFWPVKVLDAIDIAGLARDREQLWAEALAAFKTGERWWFTREEEADLRVKEEQEARRVVDPWYDELAQKLALETRPEISMPDLFRLLAVTIDRQTNRDTTRIGIIMSQLGWLMVRKGKHNTRTYIRP